jgi:hypothetical protein
MLHYDLSETNLAQSDQFPRVPTEGELLAVMVGLMLLEERAFDALGETPLTLTTENQERVAQLIEQHAWPFTQDIGAGQRLRSRLGEFVGLRISQTL